MTISTSMRMTTATFGGLAPGLLLVAIITASAFGLQHLPVFSSLSPMIAAIVSGMLFHNLLGCPEHAKAGIALAGKKLLRVAVALLGLQLTFTQIASIGWEGFVVLALAVSSTFVFTLWLGRILGVERALTELLAAGTSICGASAIAAANSVSRANDEDVSYAIACITLFGTLAMFSWPLITAALGLDAKTYGLWVGASVHEVAQVVGAAFQGGEEAGQIGVIAKLTRVLMLAPMIVALGFLVARCRRHGGSETTAKPPLVPIFIVAFLALVAANSFGFVPENVRSPLVGLTPVLLTAALASLGLGTSIAKLRLRGLKPLLLSALSTAFISLVSFGALMFL